MLACMKGDVGSGKPIVVAAMALAGRPGERLSREFLASDRVCWAERTTTEPDAASWGTATARSGRAPAAECGPASARSSPTAQARLAVGTHA